MKMLFVMLLLVLPTRNAATLHAVTVIYVNQSDPRAVNNSECWNQTESKVPPCLTLDLGLRGLHCNRQGTVMVASGTYNLMSSNEATYFDNMNGLAIVGQIDSGEPSVNVKCQEGAGLSFIHSTHVTIVGIKFWGCGAVHNSTSFNMDIEHPAYIEILAGIYFLYCMNINVTFVEVTGSPGIGMVVYNTAGENVIRDSKFSHNCFQPEVNYSSGGGLYVEFSFCNITSQECLKKRLNTSNVDRIVTSNSTYQISDCHFTDNLADIIDVCNDSFILPNRYYHISIGRGGGLSVYIVGEAFGNHFEIENCTFTGNQALWGAGMLIEFHDNSSANSVNVVDCEFSLNTLLTSSDKNGTAGGGVRLAMFSFFESNSVLTPGNIIIFHHCHFHGNKAYIGGGMSLYATKGYYPNWLYISSCNFNNNTARLGAALDISLFPIELMNAEHIANVTIADCMFDSNSAQGVHMVGSVLVGSGTVFVNAIRVSFKETNLFINNNGSALTVTDTCVTVLEDGEMTFVNNSGRYGGAMAILGNSYLVIQPNTHLVFTNNQAKFKGGAIYHYSSGERNLIGSGNCFIRYSNTLASMKEWETQFIFTDNQANNQPNSIYASTVLPCIHSGIKWDMNWNKVDVFCQESWVYNQSINLKVCKSQIRTAPNRFHVLPNYKVIPGDRFMLNASVYDDYDNLITEDTTLVLRLSDENTSFLNNESFNTQITTHGVVYMYGKENSNVTVQIETTYPVVHHNTFTVELLPCPPGYYMPRSTRPTKCVCAGKYNGFIECNEANFTSTVMSTYWIGKVEGHDDLLVGGSPYVSNISNKAHVLLPQDTEKLDDFFCNFTNSNGVLCGSCNPGYGVSAVAFEFINTPCVHCNKHDAYYHWIYYILVCFVPIVVFVFVVFLFNISITVGPLNSFIFFAQVINTVTKVNADGMIHFSESVGNISKFYLLAYDIWNLKFFEPFINGFCLSPHLDALDIILLGYVRALFPLFVLITLFTVVYFYNKGTVVVVCLLRPLHRCMARFRRFSNLRKSLMGGIAMFIVISYTQTTLLSLMILTPQSLFNADGKEVALVFYYSGNKFYNNYKYLLPAVICLLIFVILPLILLLYPSLLKFVEFLSRGKLNLEQLYPSPKVQALLDEFHGCYKDGSNGGNDYRWFASLYFLLRIVMVVIYTATETWALQYMLHIFFLLFVAFLFASLRPYRHDWINTLDVGMFLLLATISTISSHNLTEVWIGTGLGLQTVVLQQILICIPLLYCIIYCTKLLIVKSLKPRLLQLITSKKRAVKLNRIDATDRTCQKVLLAGSGTSDRNEDSTHVPDFLDFIKKSGRSPSITASPSMDYLFSSSAASVINISKSNSNERTGLLTTGVSTYGNIQ